MILFELKNIESWNPCLWVGFLHFD